MADNLDLRFRKAVASARLFRNAGADWGAKQAPVASAAELAKDDKATLDHNIRILIQQPENPKLAYETLLALSELLLREGRPLPRALSVWIADHIAGRVTKPREGGGPHAIRDLLIQHGVLAVARAHRLSPTRAESDGPKAGDGKSACDAAGMAWGMNYKAVERIWNERRGDVREAADSLL